MKLIKTSIFSFIISFIKISSGFIVNKIVAVLTGPSGIAVIGTFNNFVTIALSIANGSINTGVVKYTSEYNGQGNKLKKLFSTSLVISFTCSIVTSLVLLLFSDFFSIFLLKDIRYKSIFKVFGLTIVFYSINSLLISILNGKGDIKKYTIINTTTSIISLVLSIVLIYFFEIDGALYSLVLSQTLVFFVTVLLLKKCEWFVFDYFNKGLNKFHMVNLFKFSLMTITTALTVPISQIVVRNTLIRDLGINDAGYWQAIMRISDGYLLIVTTSLSTYFLPKLSSLKTNFEIKSEIYNGLKIITPFVLASCLIIYLLRFVIIKILFTEEFLEIESLFIWQLLGDFFKIISWIIGYLMLAKAMTKLYIITDIGFSIMYVLLNLLFIKFYGLKGATIAFSLNYFIYLIMICFLFRKIIFSKFKLS
ncbi:multi antimicrobial extrusion protein MatE [Pseudopedobacter saltans DSM 12145]|uniref:Multi antimicrobial extrusion protein MatE n=1 Tax=Pseudopedobacter saltans (strain ATCC 51119 / DSM 12145 / JCM 21818 / CCUG 39354 / LMG 10337 / NBRC 100064 / NCIMB 13643) TaxID=762903 RepID=F0SBE4_PSESL|nr:O-antigen translocase [Pseudopedobacter saltans]ADY53771.1 multi antimicrobial extrusion protein MatE [Pseudopedobacter saltans DSM 12145]